ncbi:hypothetical protein [Larkinella arboricola]
MKKSLNNLEQRANQIRQETIERANTADRVGQWFLDILHSTVLEYDPTASYEAGRWMIYNGVLYKSLSAATAGQSPETHGELWQGTLITNPELIAENGPKLPVAGPALARYVEEQLEQGDNTGAVPAASTTVAGKVRRGTEEDFEYLLDELNPHKEDRNAYVDPQLFLSMHEKLFGDGSLDATLRRGNETDRELIAGKVKRKSFEQTTGTHVMLTRKVNGVWVEAEPMLLSDFVLKDGGVIQPGEYFISAKHYYTGNLNSQIDFAVKTTSEDGVRWRFAGETTWRNMVLFNGVYRNDDAVYSILPSSQPRTVEFNRPDTNTTITRILPAGLPAPGLMDELPEGTTTPIPEGAVVSEILPTAIRSVGFSHVEPGRDSSFWLDADIEAKYMIVPEDGSEWTGVDESGAIVKSGLWLLFYPDLYNQTDNWEFVSRFNRGAGTGMPPGKQFHLLIWVKNAPNTIFKTPVWTVPTGTIGITAQNLIHEVGVLELTEIWYRNLGERPAGSGSYSWSYMVVGTPGTKFTYQINDEPINPLIQPSPVSANPPTADDAGNVANISRPTAHPSAKFFVDGVEIASLDHSPGPNPGNWTKVWSKPESDPGQTPQQPSEAGTFGPPWENVITKQVAARMPNFLSVKVTDYNGQSDIATFGADVGLMPGEGEVIKWRVNHSKWKNLPITATLPKGMPHLFQIVSINPNTPESDWTRNAVGAGDRAKNEAEQVLIS